MDDIKTLVLDTSEHIFSDLSTVEVINDCEVGKWPEALWQALEDNGLTRALLPADQDGSGLGLREAVAVLELAGYYAAPVPLAETWLAGLALAQAGQEVPTGPLTTSTVPAKDALDEHLEHVTWGRLVPVVWLSPASGDPRLQLIHDARVVHEGSNMAGEPSDHIHVRDGRVTVDTTTPWSMQHWLALGALLRSAQMAGALRRCLELSCDYVTERKQFGRPLAKFQAIQQQLALLAGEVAATTVSVEAAAVAGTHDKGLLDIAVAKARTGMAVEPGTRISHQVHGAIGFSYEHRLHHYTRRLWAWRNDFGTEHYWNNLLGQYALDTGGHTLWPQLITRLGAATLPQARR